MHVQYGFAGMPEAATGLTIGAFDGVHLGHQALIRWMARGAEQRGWRPWVLTFDPVPRQVLQGREAQLLSSLEGRLEYLAALDVAGTVILPFDAALIETPAEAFVTQLVARMGMRGLWIGPDFTLGRQREGDVAHLRALGDRRGFEVNVFEARVTWDAAPVRSSRIRRALRAGRVAEARGCLGRPYRMDGPVVYGDQRGRVLGFPTANLDLPAERLRPANGVYICRAHVPQGSFAAITNVGTRPTFNNRPPTVEAHLLDFCADIYGETLQLDFLKRLRPEEKFPSADALIRQMARDEAEARAWFRARQPKPAPVDAFS